MNVLISGSHGMVGSALLKRLKAAGHQPLRLVRSSPSADNERAWDPEKGIQPGAFDGVDALVHLAGESIAKGRWTEAKKTRLRNSRVRGTRTLAQAIAGLDQRPATMICASAVGYYGDRGDEILTEDSPAGRGFLAEVCQEWEAACAPAAEAGVRVVNLRIGVVLSTEGGALPKMLTPFKLGVGGKIGSGEQYMSWIALDDLVGIIEFCLARQELAGPVNVATPNPVTNKEFTKTLGGVLHRPTILPVPAIAARTVLGEMADELLLASARVIPRRLQDARFAFRFPELESALRHALGRA